MKQRPRRNYSTPKPPRAMPDTAPAQLVRVEKPIYGGSFLARVDGKAVFVPLALPHEEVKIRVTQEKRGYVSAELDQIVNAAPQRIAPSCRHFGACGGCDYQHANYATQLEFKRAILRETLERGGVRSPETIEVLAGTATEAWNYRNRIRLALNVKGDVGYRGRRSNTVIPIAECPIAAPLLVRAALALAETARHTAPQLRVEEISLFCDAAETTLLASVFGSHADKNAFGIIARAISEQVSELKGMEFVTAPDRQGNEQSPRVLARWGDTHLLYQATGFDYRVDHGAFFQVNRYLVDRLVKKVSANRSGRLAWDLFAGVGLFARKLTEGFERVTAVESAPAAMPGLEANLHATNGTALQAWTLDFLRSTKSRERPDLIVVDPPRAGLGAEITSALADVGSPAMTYVSCDPATLARDLRALIVSGYEIESVTLVDLFPQTFHLETVVHLLHS